MDGISPFSQKNDISKVKPVLSNFGWVTFSILVIKNPTQQLAMLLTPLTWYLGGELGDDGGAIALGCASTQGEGVRGAWVEACEHVGGLVAQLHNLPTLVGEVQLRVKGAHRLVGDLGRKEMNILIVASATPR